MCSWLPFAEQLAELDLRALAINFVSTSLDDDMVAGARELQRRGAERIMLVGASMGGTAALVAAGRSTSPVWLRCRRRGSSAASMLSPLSAASRFQRSFSWVGKTQASPATRGGYRAGVADKDLVVTSGAEHGTDLLQDPEAERALLRFLLGE